MLVMSADDLCNINTRNPVQQHKGFVVVHIGAGYHSPANCDLYKQVCRCACEQAIHLLREKRSALEAVTAAIVALEDSQWTNAGLGSNLSLDGSVECDASIMDGLTLQFGAVGAVSGVKNPVLVAESLLRTQMQGEMSLGRIPPSILVGPGAREWAVRHAIPTVAADQLITDSSRKSYIKNKRKLEMFEDGSPNNDCHKLRRIESSSSSLDEKQLVSQSNGSVVVPDIAQDTVGAICVDDDGNVASAVSSGGIILKQPGRLGQAALFGCGCWAENDTLAGVGVGVSTSGCGEHLTKTLLARECADCLKRQHHPTSALYDCFMKKFIGSSYIKTVRQPLGGAVTVSVDSSREERLDVDVSWAHTTESMCLAYMSSNDTQAEALVSRLPDGLQAGKAVHVQSKSYVVTSSS